jgi:HEAT repeat protein
MDMLQLEETFLEVISESDNIFERENALRIVLSKGQSNYGDLILKLISDKDPVMRAGVISEFLDRVDPHDAYHICAETVQNDPDPNVRFQAAIRLGELGDSSAHSILQRVMLEDQLEETTQGYTVAYAAKVAIDRLDDQSS